MKKYLIAVTVLLWTAITCAAITVDQVPNVHVADRNRYVSNPDGVLSDTTVSRLDAELGRLWDATTAEPVVVVIENLPEDSDIDTFATELFGKWGIGRKEKDNGVLMVVARGDRKAVIRTGYGAEGALPDIAVGRILRNVMFPKFREGDFDGGVSAGVAAIGKVLTDPAYAEELRSEQRANSRSGEVDDEGNLLVTLGKFAIVMTSVAVVLLLWTLWRTRRMDVAERWRSLDGLRMAMLILAFLSFGVGFIVYGIMALYMKRMRNRKRKCPNCGTSMDKIDEEHDNDYLTPAQDTEERLNSVDYDVWVCPSCREVDVYPFVNRQSAYQVCERCGSRASSLARDRVVVRPTERTRGQGEKTFVCRNCGARRVVTYVIPVLASAPIIIGGPGGHGGGGGFSGGSFGGGMTGGGGASGGW